MKRAFLLAVLFAGLSVVSFSQEKAEETSDSLNFYVADSDRYLKFDTFNIGDLNGFQQYRAFGKNHLPYARSGNLGLVAHPLKLKKNDWSINQLLGGYGIYTLTEDSLKYYSVSRPLTELSYVNGSKSEQFFKVFHTQNLGDGMNISFNYQRMTSEGYFLRQLTNHTRFNFNYNLHSRNRRFHSRGFYLINNFKSQENGGIFLSENNDPSENTVLLDINLYDAQNRGRSQEAGIENQYAIFQKDSANTLVNLIHKVTYKRSFRNYQHDLSNSNKDFYANAYFDTTYTADSIYADDIGNFLGLSFFNNRLTIGAQHHAYHYAQNNLIEEQLNSIYLNVDYADTLMNQAVAIDFEKGLSGYHEEEMDLNAGLAFQKLKTLQIKLKLGLAKKRADYFLEHYRSNQYRYQNDFNLVNTQKVGISVKDDWSGIGLSFEGKSIENYIYFDSLSIPQQHELAIQVWSLKLDKKFSFFKGRLNLLNRLAFQQFSESEIIPLPNFYSYHSLYYKNSFFNNHLHMEAGLDFYYISTYDGYAYSPASTYFHLRSDGSPLGDINQLDVFVNLEIMKNATLFFKFENILYNSFSEETYRIENYPIPARALKVGLSWRMLN